MGEGAIKITKWCDYKDQAFGDGKKRWRICGLIERSATLEVFEIPLKHLNIANLYPRLDSMREYISHIKQVLDADLDKPIILDDEGYVMDGRHRIAKALIEERETIKAVRFEKTPDADYTEGD